MRSVEGAGGFGRIVGIVSKGACEGKRGGVGWRADYPIQGARDFQSG